MLSRLLPSASLGKLRLGTWQETDEQRSDGGYRHEEMLVERIAMSHSFPCLLKGVVTDEQVGHQINKQQLPCGQTGIFLYKHCAYEQHYSYADEQQLTVQAAMLVIVVMLVVMVMMLMRAAAMTLMLVATMVA